MLDVVYAHSVEEARLYSEKGYEPIECAFGDVSVVGRYTMDHHGSLSYLEGVAIRAYRDHFGALKADPRFVVTGAPDADAILAIVCLAELVPVSKINPNFVSLVDKWDREPIGVDLLSEDGGVDLLFFKQQRLDKYNRLPFYESIEEMVKILDFGLSYNEKRNVIHMEEVRVERSLESIVAEMDHVLVADGQIWGFDVWYRSKQFVVSRSAIGSIAIGCVNAEIAEEVLGEGGLLNVFKELGEGWGGREAIGGCPRGKKYTREETLAVAHKVNSIVERRKHAV